MLFDSSLRKELGRSFGATLVVLITIVMTMMLIRTLGQASAGHVNPSEIMLVMGFTVLGHLPTILTLSLFVAITATLSRMYMASEMVVWFASGRGLLAFLPPLLRFAWPVLLGIAVLALVVWPWTNQQVRELRERYESRGDVDRVAPGQFIESAGGRRVLYIDKKAADAVRSATGAPAGRTDFGPARPDAETEADAPGGNIFIAATEKGREIVTSARGGRLQTQGAERFVILDQGQRLETDLETGEMRLSEFREYGARVSARSLDSAGLQAPRYRSTLALLRQPDRNNQAEFSWRLGLALAALNCVVIALAGTRVNPRVGRSAGMVFSLFAFAAYYNLLNVGQSWVASGKVSLAALLCLLHGGIFAAALGALLLRAGQAEDGVKGVVVLVVDGLQVDVGGVARVAVGAALLVLEAVQAALTGVTAGMSVLAVGVGAHSLLLVLIGATGMGTIESRRHRSRGERAGRGGRPRSGSTSPGRPCGTGRRRWSSRAGRPHRGRRRPARRGCRRGSR